MIHRELRKIPPVLASGKGRVEAEWMGQNLNVPKRASGDRSGHTIRRPRVKT